MVLALFLVVFLTPMSLAAPLGTAITYQGHLYDTNNVADGFYDFQFKLYDANSSGSQQGGDVNIPDLDVIDGYFTVELDFGSSVFDGNSVWLEIGVRPGVQNDPCAYTPLVPRQAITPVPYALYAASAPDGISTPLELSNSLTSPVISGTNTGSGTGVYGKNDTTGNYGELGRGDYGVYGYTTNSSGVYGKNITTGNYGYLGSTANGARGWSATGKGVLGGSNSGYGVVGEADTGTGVYGRNTNSGNYGELGLPGCGVFGKHNANNNFGYIASSEYGVYGQYDSTDSNSRLGYIGSSEYGVYGQYDANNYGHLGGDFTGVYGESSSGFGMLGSSFDGAGVKGSSAYGTGVKGESLFGNAGSFIGNVGVTGHDECIQRKCSS